MEITLPKVAGAMRDLTPCMRQVAGILMDSMEENFAQQGRPKWTALKASTIRQRVKLRKWPGQILIRSQAGLKASISTRSDANSATIGTNKVYGRIHQKGGQAGRGRKVTIPARPYLGVTDKELGEIETKILNHATQNS
ncbi:MAG: phage virion morphogenesis protein [Spirochaetes bacterium RIFOXYC1_FULL_54_7]|nr:MAG: phage virion morphogenesis protein [Spirochaetes bacterium RIFOXYC1_FULL_54_7]